MTISHNTLPSTEQAAAPLPGPTVPWLTRYFDRIVVISLAHRTDRRQRVASELARLGIEVGHTRGVEWFDAIRPSDADGFNSVGRRGCFLSHFTVVKRAHTEGWDRVLILEDDAVFTPAMSAVGEGLVRHLIEERPWHVAFLGYINVAVPAGPPDWLPLDPNRLGMHCYALNRAVLPALVEYMTLVEKRPAGHPDGGRMGVDGTQMMFAQRNPWCRVLMARPNLAIQGSSASDLLPRWFDRTPIVRDAAALARRLRGAVTGYQGRPA